MDEEPRHNVGDRVCLRFRPLSVGSIEGVAEDKWKVRLDSGMTLFAEDGDLLPENN